MNPFSITHPDGQTEVLYSPSPKQAEFHSRTEPNVLFVGARGTGKSVALRWEAHIRAMSTPGFTYVILRRTYPELQKSHLLFMHNEMKKLGGYFHTTDKIAYYPNGSRGFFSHCGSQEDVLNLLSAQFCWMGFDEISTFEWDMVTKLAASVRVPENLDLVAMVRACTNPLGVSADMLNRYYILKDIEPEEDPDYDPLDWYAVKVKLEDGVGIDKEQYRKRFAGLAPHVRKAWLDGEFVLENALFDFSPSRNGATYHVIKYIDLEKLVSSAQIYRAYDHGYFPDPAVCLWIAHLGNRYIVFHEKVWFKSIASEIAESIKEETQRLEIPRVSMTYCDPTIDIHTGADIRTIKDTFEMNGVPMECSVNSRELFASSIHTALAEEVELGPGNLTPKIQFYDGGKYAGCPYLIKSLPQMRYDPKHPLRLANHKDDHPVVTLAYFLISTSSMDRQSSSQVKLRPWQKQKKADRFILGSESVQGFNPRYPD
jgi:hypothetical protein